jgi:hypothetical protein
MSSVEKLEEVSLMIATLIEKPKGLRFNAELSRHMRKNQVQYLMFEIRRNGTIIMRPDRLGSKVLTNGNTISPIYSVCTADLYDKIVPMYGEGRVVFNVTWNGRMNAYVMSDPSVVRVRELHAKEA